MQRNIIFWGFMAVLFVAFLAVSGAIYVVPETEQVIVTQFGQPVGKPVKTAGLHMKVPFIQEVHRIEKRVLEWDGPSTEMPTQDKLYIVVDAFARWRISDPLQYFIRMRDERSALSRLDDIIGSEMRSTIARHALVEIVRTTKGRKPAQDATIAAAAASGSVTGTLPAIQFGRVALEDEVAEQSRRKLTDLGIELLDVRFKRVNYNPAVAGKIYDRMTSERRQIAERFRSEGAGEAAKILGTRERDIKQIESEAYRKVQAIQGKADAEATTIYAQAFNQSPQAREFYSFQRTLEIYRTSFDRSTTLILTTDGGFLRFLKGNPGPAPAAPPPSAPTPPAAPPQP
jgi:modulator of FtsH protease HflC